MNGTIVFAGIAPHPPLLVPAVGGSRIGRVRKSADALRRFSSRLLENRPEALILISPHAPHDPRRFTVHTAPRLHGDFRDFLAPAVRLEFPNDPDLLGRIGEAADNEGLQLREIRPGEPLDHGALVPLYYFHEAGWQGPTVVCGFTSLANPAHLAFGRALRAAAEASGKRVALIASGDLSHRLIVGGPYEYEPTAHRFDEQIVEGIARGDTRSIIDIDQELRMRAGECGYRSIIVALGCVGEPADGEVLSYEGPYGVGYMVAVLLDAEARRSGGHAD